MAWQTAAVSSHAASHEPSALSQQAHDTAYDT